jgi:hypothetical protein
VPDVNISLCLTDEECELREVESFTQGPTVNRWEAAVRAQKEPMLFSFCSGAFHVGKAVIKVIPISCSVPGSI